MVRLDAQHKGFSLVMLSVRKAPMPVSRRKFPIAWSLGRAPVILSLRKCPLTLSLLKSAPKSRGPRWPY